MTIQVEMLAFGDGQLRTVEIPDAEAAGCDTEGLLELVFYYGQNDFQPRPMPSVSVGDVARLPDGRRFECAGFGWEEITR